MRKILTTVVVGLVILSSASLGLSQEGPDDLARLYKVAKELIGSNGKTVIVSEPHRLVVSKAEATGEIVLIPITGLRNKIENRMSSFPGYSLSEKGNLSTRVYQCSWSDMQNKVVYECGETMKLPAGLREAVSDDSIHELKHVIKSAASRGEQTSLLAPRH